MAKGKVQKEDAVCAAAGLLKQLAHPVRLSILCQLLHAGEGAGEMRVSDIVQSQEGRASQSQISQFLAKMRQEGLVKTRKEAQTVYYSIKSKEVQVIIESLYGLYCHMK